MLAKLLEVRIGDEVIPIMAIDMRDDTGKDRGWLLQRAGYSYGLKPDIIAFELETQTAVRFFVWGRHLRNYLPAAWYSLKDGDVVDIDHLDRNIPEVRKSARYDV